MSSTITLKPIARRFVTGVCNGPQGADGVGVLAREACLSMLGAAWADDAREAMMPVHEYDRDPPFGQAYKAVWGYDDGTRSERSSCGAECYSYRIPADALDSTNQDGVAEIESVVVRLAGDRYLDKGACLWCEISSDPIPSPIAVAMASGAGTAYLATQNQTGADGLPLAPNRRNGTEAAVTLDLDSASPALFLHVHLFLSDYLGVRGAWIEGGAMFADEAVEVQFSRDVEVAASDSEAGAVALDVGRVTFGATVTPAYAVRKLPRVSVWQNFLLTADTDAVGAETNNTFAQRVTDLLAFIRSAPALWSPAHATAGDANALAASATLACAQTGLLKISSTAIGFCCLCAHGLTDGRAFRGLRFTSALPGSIPYRLLVYGISADLDIASSASGSTLRFATPLAHWADILSRAFREGKANSVRLRTDSGLTATTMPAVPDSATTSVAVQPLAARSVSSAISRVEFDRPFVSGEISSIIMALVPDGAPSGETESTTTLENCPATRSVTATIPVSATRQDLTSGSTTMSGYYFEFSVNESIFSRTRATVSGAGLTSAGKWNSVIMNSSSATVQNVSTAKLTSCFFEVAYGGKTYHYDTDLGDSLPSLSFPVDFVYGGAPSSNTGELAIKYQSHGNYSFSIDLVAHADDGTRQKFRINMPAHSVECPLTTGPNVSPARWVTTGVKNENTIGMGYMSEIQHSYYGLTFRAVLAGGVYSFASSSNETAVATVRQTGSITFTHHGVTYSAQYDFTKTPLLGLSNKSGTHVICGNDTAETATPYGAVHGLNDRLKFTGSDGSMIWAQVVLPQGTLAGDVPFRAVSAYNGSAQGIGTVTDAGLKATVIIVEAYAEETVDPGLITLYE